MVGNKAAGALRWLTRSSNALFQSTERPTQCLASQAVRSMATEAQTAGTTPIDPIVSTSAPAAVTETADIAAPTWNLPPVLATLYNFPSMEPLKFVEYSQKQLLLPMRRDILHRAIVFEGDATRQGTASTKWRDDVRGSGRKIQPQKGTGRARAGDKKSPIRRGGGVAFGPHPRDFSTELPRKIYDLAMRTALSYRYRRGQLIVVDEISVPRGASPYYLKEIFESNNWGKSHGRSLLITDNFKERLFRTVDQVGADARVLEREDVDVKDILETGRVIIESKALHILIRDHSKDLTGRIAKARY